MSGFTTRMQSATIRYTAPELFLEEEDFIPHVEKETDVWAFAMTVIEVPYCVSSPLSFHAG